MCRCCQTCLEDFYWNFCEEKFCYDETIAYYNPEEDEHYKKKGRNTLIQESIENNNGPILNQPTTTNFTTISSKIHEDDFYREIQTQIPILAPEILSVFANSQIFHEHQSTTATKQLSKLSTPTLVHKKPNQTDTEKLLDRLEGKTVIKNENSPSNSSKNLSSNDTIANSQILPSINSESNISVTDSVEKAHIIRPKLDNKLLKHVQNIYRTASENDIFVISSHSQISMTPEIPSISYSTLPKNYIDTPTNIDKYRESPSLQSIQVANSALISESDLTMPRYFRKSELITQSADNVNFSHHQSPLSTPKPKRHKDLASKRMKHFRSKLPPLVLHKK